MKNEAIPTFLYYFAIMIGEINHNTTIKIPFIGCFKNPSACAPGR